MFEVVGQPPEGVVQVVLLQNGVFLSIGIVAECIRNAQQQGYGIIAVTTLVQQTGIAGNRGDGASALRPLQQPQPFLGLGARLFLKS